MKIISNTQGFGDTLKNSGYKLYDQEIDAAQTAKKSSVNETNPLVVKEGFLGMDDIDRIRRRKLK